MSENPDRPTFDIPVRPERRFPPGGGVSYEGRTVFALHADPPLSRSDLEAHLHAVLAADSYTYGGRDGFPEPVYLVHDRQRRTVLRVVVRDARLELHALPNTDSETIRALYDRLREREGLALEVERRISRANG